MTDWFGSLPPVVLPGADLTIESHEIETHNLLQSTELFFLLLSISSTMKQWERGFASCVEYR